MAPFERTLARGGEEPTPPCLTPNPVDLVTRAGAPPPPSPHCYIPLISSLKEKQKNRRGIGRTDTDTTLPRRR